MIEFYTEGVIAGTAAVFIAGIFWFIKWMHKPCKPYAGPRIAVYVQHGETRGWIKKFNGTQNPELTLDIWERLVAPALTIAKDLKLLYENGWVLSVCTGINKMEVFGTESYSFSEYDTRKGKPQDCHCGGCKGDSIMHEEPILGREGHNRQCWECRNCSPCRMNWGGSSFHCDHTNSDYRTHHLDVPAEAPCHGNGWLPK